MLSDSRTYMELFNFVGDGLRDLLDPRQRQ